MDKIKSLEEKIKMKEQQLLKTRVWFVAVRLRMEIITLKGQLLNLRRKSND